MSRIVVAVLGATGMVGQHMLRMLEDHPWLQLRAVWASDRSVGQLYGDAAPWRIEGEPPAELAKMVVRGCNPPHSKTHHPAALPPAAIQPAH